MEINEYQKKVLLEMLTIRVKEEQHIINKLTQTVIHNENWAIPIAKDMNNDKILKGMNEVVEYAKRDIESNKNDLDQIKDLIEKIKNT
jgi:hypothetical protein